MAAAIGDMNPGVASALATTTSSPASEAAKSAITGKGLADNFQTFLTLLTTQLKNQNPLDPLDTNQFTQQLVQFAQVEQQLKSNTQLETLVSLQKTAQATQALDYVGTTVAVDGAATKLANGSAKWSFTLKQAGSAAVAITNSAGQTVYTGTYSTQAGAQEFSWDGRGNNGTQWPDGTYRIAITAKDTSGQSAAVSTEVEGVVSSVDLTSSPPLLTLNGQTFTLDQVKRVTKAAK